MVKDWQTRNKFKTEFFFFWTERGEKRKAGWTHTVPDSHAVLIQG